MFQPRSCSFAARCCCDQPFLVRHFRTCGPMRFNETRFTALDGNHGGMNGCVHTHTIVKNWLVFSKFG
jgi:hypothetical protein